MALIIISHDAELTIIPEGHNFFCTVLFIDMFCRFIVLMHEIKPCNSWFVAQLFGSNSEIVLQHLIKTCDRLLF